MPEIAVDFSDVPVMEAFPGGQYTMEVVSMTLVESKGPKTTGFPMLKPQFKVIGDPEYENRRVFDNLILRGDAKWKAQQFFVSLFGKGCESWAGDTEELVGEQFTADVVQEVWAVEDGGDGVTRNKIAKYVPAEAAAQVPSASKLFA